MLPCLAAQACRADVEAFCRDVEPGDGRVHICLRQNKDKLSDPCRAGVGSWLHVKRNLFAMTYD
jgi:hypothetical protein